MKINEIKERFLKEFPGSEIELIDDSESHKGHHPEYEKYGITHIRVGIISDIFQGKKTLQRHQMIYGCFKTEMHTGELHSLSILYTKTPSEKS